ncbi:MAG: DEAD/DEAH box helicase family protein [Candidatus Marinimicrobia bacterium]|nr:DEAD/DEAH box helicase family protein [Candidatus Neomarinimicrobiota bacterium]
MNEQETRTNLILPAIQQAGWGTVEGSRIREEYPITKGRLVGGGKRSMPDKADYVLQYKNRNLAVIEAKRDDSHYTEGVGQAKDYAERLQVRYTYSTNGLQIYGMDMQKGEEDDVSTYPTPEELWEMTFAEADSVNQDAGEWRDRFHKTPFETRSGTWQPRYYQENAITNTLDAIAKGQNRILLTLATGTGKTAIAFQIAWKLFHSRWNIRKDGQRLPRILFLADRNILADQAFNAFSAFEEDALVRISPSEIRKKGKVPKNGSIFFTIFQSFMAGENNEPHFGQYPKDYFDFIVIDECHRGGANDESNWRAIMEYFSPAVQLGLTATPKRDKNIDTYRYFGEPVYIYSLKEGINDGFLTPFKVKQIHTTIDEYIYTPDDEVEQGEIETSKVYTEAEMNRVIVIKAREEFRVKKFLSLMSQNQKTIVFCATQKHALAVRDLINQNADSTNANYCHRVTADDGKLGEQHLRDFQDNEKIIPTILTTSQKLSTGVDAPELKNIVLMRPVNSMIEFKQIIGRGTRLFDGKDYFTLYDFVGAHKHFLDPEWDGDAIKCETCGELTCICEEKPCKVCGDLICTCPPKLCKKCNESPCICEKPEPEPCVTCGYIKCRCYPTPKMIKVKISELRVMELDSMVQTSFWSPDGKPISSHEFLTSLFGSLPDFFKDEGQLRAIWSKPDTRKKLLQDLNEKGYTHSQLEDLRHMIHAEDSDLYDVLAHVAFSVEPVKRSQRAEYAKSHFGVYESNQRVFLDFVLKQYIQTGFTELNDAKLPDLLTLKYKAINDAKRELGDISSIRETFIGFQSYLYQKPK